jgi:hypothetical protein
VGTAGDDYLSRLLGTDEPTGPDNEITEAEAKARAAEHTRVFNTRFNPFNDGSTTATTTMHGTGPGGYRFDAETVKSKITQWEQLLDDLQNDVVALQQAMQNAVPPSADKPAAQQVEATRTSIKAAIDHNAKMRDYATAYIIALKKANGTYSQHDADVATAIKAPTTGTGKLYQ